MALHLPKSIPSNLRGSFLLSTLWFLPGWRYCTQIHPPPIHLTVPCLSHIHFLSPLLHASHPIFFWSSLLIISLLITSFSKPTFSLFSLVLTHNLLFQPQFLVLTLLCPLALTGQLTPANGLRENVCTWCSSAFAHMHVFVRVWMWLTLYLFLWRCLWYECFFQGNLFIIVFVRAWMV